MTRVLNPAKGRTYQGPLLYLVPLPLPSLWEECRGQRGVALIRGVAAGQDSGDQAWERRFGALGTGTNGPDCTQALSAVLGTLLALMLLAVVQAVMAVASLQGASSTVLAVGPWPAGLASGAWRCPHRLGAEADCAGCLHAACC